MESPDYIISLLEKDIPANISFINFIKNNGSTFLKNVEEGIVGKGISDHEWVYLYCPNRDNLEKLLVFCKNDLYFAVIENWMLPLITAGRKIDWQLTTRRYILPETAIIDQSEKLMPLKTSDTEWIYEKSKYKDFLSVDYIKDRIQKGLSKGIRINSKLVAWVMTQDDGAIGFLTVLPEYQKRGLALKLMNSIIDEIRNNNNTPFAYVEDNNDKAVNLCLKMGFQKDRLIHWIKLL